MKIPPLKWKVSLNKKQQETLLWKCYYNIDLTKFIATMQGIRSKNRIGKITNMQENTFIWESLTKLTREGCQHESSRLWRSSTWVLLIILWGQLDYLLDIRPYPISRPSLAKGPFSAFLRVGLKAYVISAISWVKVLLGACWWLP